MGCRRNYDSAHTSQASHIAQVNQVVRHFTGNHNQGAAFLEADISRSNQQVIRSTRHDAAKGTHGTRHHHHSRIISRTTGAFGKEVLHIGQFIHILEQIFLALISHHAPTRWRHQGGHVVSQAFQVHRNTCGINGAACTGHPQNISTHVRLLSNTRNATPKKHGFTCTSSNPFFSANATKSATGKKRNTELTKYS